jgi:hypothetical protein
MTFTAFFVGQKAIDTQQSHYSNLKDTLDNKSMEVVFGDSEFTSSIKGDGFVIVKDGKILVDANNISTKHNWMEVMSQFVDNYNNPDPIDGYYGYGQRAPKTADYLCKDCGYIVEFQAGDVFPVCEVCQAGEPDGPSRPEEGYWEEL